MDNNLWFYRRAPQGYQLAWETPLTSGWYPEQARDGFTGEQEIRIFVVDKDVLPQIHRQVAAIAFNGTIYQAKLDPPPLGEPYVWRIVASPTGEVQPV